jgi:hypothetical protein
MMVRKYIYLPESHWQILQRYATAKGFESPSLALESLIRQLVQRREPAHGRREDTAH